VSLHKTAIQWRNKDTSAKVVFAGKKLESAGKNMVREEEKRGAATPPPHTLQLSYAGSKKLGKDGFTNATLFILFASGHTLKGLPTGKDCIKCPTLWSD
jgi:hypothetical protein